MEEPTKAQQELERNNAALMSGEELILRAVKQFMARENLTKMQATTKAHKVVEEILFSTL